MSRVHCLKGLIALTVYQLSQLTSCLALRVLIVVVYGLSESNFTKHILEIQNRFIFKLNNLCCIGFDDFAKIQWATIIREKG